MATDRREFLKKAALGGAVAAAAPMLNLPGMRTSSADAATFKKRITGGDMYTSTQFGVSGTDLGIPYTINNGNYGFIFGDTFSTPWPETGQNWRSPVVLRSNSLPGSTGGIVFQSAYKLPTAPGIAPEVMKNGHNGIGIDNLWEVSVIPNDGIYFPETGRHVISYMSIENWNLANGAMWKSRYAGLAYSDDGNNFTRVSTKWFNTSDNKDPYQMWSMQRMGDYVYIFSVRSGRQTGPMMLKRVRWDRILDPTAYEGWGYANGSWKWGNPCSPILNGKFGEPSVRRLSDGTWAMAYLNCNNNTIVSRFAPAPDVPWTNEKTQVTWNQEPYLYGGFIHPLSTKATNNLHLIVSKWATSGGKTSAYHASQYVGTL